MVNCNIEKRDTSILKGIAIIAMLCHHLWSNSSIGLLQYLGIYGKVCVAIFVFCSGYALACQYSKIMDESRESLHIKRVFSFILKRLIKFYANYWIIFIIFVPISIFLFHRSLSEAYGENGATFVNLVVDIFGLKRYHSYNITWWFNSLIICLYLLFPLLYWCCKRFKWITLLISLSLLDYWNRMSILSEICLYQFPFVLGILWVNSNKIKTKLKNSIPLGKVWITILLIVAIFVFSALRLWPIIPYFSGIRVDGIIALFLAILVVYGGNYFKHVNSILAYCGKHAGNIYLIHTFYFYYWPTSHWFYTGNVMQYGFNLIVLLLVCIVNSIVIEFFKEKVGIYRLTNQVIKKI